MIRPAKDPGYEMVVPEGWGFATSFDRRDFLKGSAAGLLIVIVFDGLGALEAMAQEGERPAGNYPTDFNAYVHIDQAGKVTCYVGKIEMGQGVMTSFPQLVAEELGVPLAAVSIVMGDTDLCPWDMGTFGSLSTRFFGPVLRKAAAEARAVLIQLAAEKLKVPEAELRVEVGTVVHTRDPKKRVTFGELTQGQRIERKLSGKPELLASSAYTIVGTSPPRRDAVEKVTGKAKYAGDVVPPGALHARLLRPPAHGAVLATVDTSEAEKVPGVKVVHEGDLVAVLHASREEADRALQVVKATFRPARSTLTDENIFEHLAKAAPEGETPSQGGSLAEGQKLATRTFEDTYTKGYVAHAAMETHSAVAAFENRKLTIWSSTQTPWPLKSQLMKTFNLGPEQVRVITPYVGGGFGGKSAGQQSMEAARLAMMTGKPVRVVWSRAEEFFFDTFDMAAVIKVRSGLNASNQIVYWDYEVIGAGPRGAVHFYEIPNHRTVVRGGWSHNPPGFHPFAVGPWRAPGSNANAFARESQIDVMAAKAGVDPMEFRLKHLSDPRMKRVLEAAAKQFGWTPKAGPSGRGYGVACSADAGAVTTNMAELKVDKSSGKIDVVRLLCVQEMGVVVSPEGAKQQIEGGMTMGLGYALSEEVRFKDGAVLDTNFDTYELPRFAIVPKIETLILPSDGPAQGGGEPAIVPMGAVLANAVFDAVGARVRQLPMTPERVKAAMKA
jgi:nicotinate dehydrogenase subunit B